VAEEEEREAKSMHPASGLVPVSVSAAAVPMMPMMPMVPMMAVAVAVLEQPVQPICLRNHLGACAIRGS
jgi:hypothetical protein